MYSTTILTTSAIVRHTDALLGEARLALQLALIAVGLAVRAAHGPEVAGAHQLALLLLELTALALVQHSHVLLGPETQCR